MTNKTAMMTGLKKMKFVDSAIPEIKSDEVLVKLEYIGICGSDVHYYEHGRIGDYVVEGDFILGHECAGTITAIGSKASHVAVGDRVALEPGATCGKCEYCKTGRYNLCPGVIFLATPPVQGCFQNYIAFPADLAFKLPEGISTREGALIEPLAVGLEAAQTAGVKLGGSVVILGAGCIGLTTLLACKAAGAGKIIAVDIISKRLDKAKELGASYVINAAEEDAIKRVLELTGGEGADFVMETAGSTVTTQHTPFVVKRGGTIVLVGMAQDDVIPFNFAKLMGQCANMRTIFRYKNQFPVAINAISSGSIDISGVVSHEFAFDDLEEAFRQSMENKNETVKIVIKMT